MKCIITGQVAPPLTLFSEINQLNKLCSIYNCYDLSFNRENKKDQGSGRNSKTACFMSDMGRQWVGYQKADNKLFSLNKTLKTIH